MTKQEVRDAFLEELAPLLPGFRPRKKDGSLVRKIPGGAQVVGLAIADYNPEFLVSLVFTTRLEQAEAITNAVLQTPERYRSTTVTTATVLAHFFPDEAKKEFKVTGPGDVAAAVRELDPHLRGRIVPFLDAHQDAKALEAILNSDEGRSFDRTNPPYREMASLVLAHLAGSPRYPELAAKHSKAAEAWDPDNREKLAALIRHLDALRT
jgi:hypothetical protein